MLDKIIIKGAKEHNLKDIDLELPKNCLIVITGLSGSGKSTLAFDTIYAEGQRRYVESLSSYARQFLGQMEKPNVESIEGLSPSICIDQKSTSHNPRSTVATVTEIYDYLRLLYARIGIPHDPVTKKPLSKQSKQEIVNAILAEFDSQRIQILAPIIAHQKGEHKAVIEKLLQNGYTKLRLDGEFIDMSDIASLDRNKSHDLDVVVDRIIVDSDQFNRLNDAVEQGLRLGDGIIKVLIGDSDNYHEKFYSEHYTSAGNKINLGEIEPRMFSFNAPQGACPNCMGLGKKMEIDTQLVLPNYNLTIAEGAIRPWSRGGSYQNLQINMLEKIGEYEGFTINQALSELNEKQIQIILFGYDLKIPITSKSGNIYNFNYEGVIPQMQRRYTESSSEYARSEINKFMRELICPECNGKRLKPEILNILIADNSIADITNMTVAKASKFFRDLEINDNQQLFAAPILKEINARLKFLIDVGLDYLSLDRSAGTLAGGEAQRIRLATQIGSGLTGVLYVLDEPSIGLHQRDNDRLIGTLRHLQQTGNTVIVVEHDYDTIIAADHIVDIGPGAGNFGGEVVAAGKIADIVKSERSITGQYLSGKKFISLPKKYRKGSGKFLNITGAKENNLKDLNVSIPLGKMVVITGVSGSGKSTLVNDILANYLTSLYHHANPNIGQFKEITGTENLDKAIVIDQSPIGRTPRSNTATYTGLFTVVRELFAGTNVAKELGYGPGRFSFNVKGGRCDKCEGDGILKIEMHFLPDIFITCDECKGKRYNQDTLDIKYRDKTIADVLEMTVTQAKEFFKNFYKIYSKLETLERVGLGYIKLGQSATTLSGGEAQRIKLATELARRSTGNTVYILDEPTTGLHFADVSKLIDVLNHLTDAGNSIIVIEHNLDVIKSADWIIDLGPEGGEGGGSLVASGTPKQIIADYLAKKNQSYTAKYLNEYIEHPVIIES